MKDKLLKTLKDLGVNSIDEKDMEKINNYFKKDTKKPQKKNTKK